MQNSIRIPKNQVLSRNTIEQREHCDDSWSRRVSLVDPTGEKYSTANRLPVDAIVSVSQNPADTPIIYNVPVALANTEYSQALPDGTVHWLIRVRENNAKLQFAFTSGDSGTNYITVKYGNTYESNNVYLTNKVVYFRVTKPNTNVEILTWS